MAISIPYELPGAERAKLELAAIREEFTKSQKAVIDLAAKTEQGEKAFKELTDAFVQGKIGAKDVRESLAKVAEQAPKTGAELARAARDAEKMAEESRKAGDTFGNLNERLRGASESVEKYTFAFNQVTETIGRVAGAVRDGVEKVVELSGEFNRVNGAARETGINFEAAAHSTGVYVDQLNLATSAMRFNQAGQEVNQRQMEALISRAREFSRVNGDFKGSFEALTDAVLEGEEDGLRRFGGSLASLGGETHTVQERLQALTRDVQTQGTEVVTAADRWESFKGSITEASREASGGFMQGLTDALNQGDLAVQRVDARTVQLTRTMSESDRAIHENTLRVQAFENSLTRTEVFEAFGHGAEGMRQTVSAAGNSVMALGHGILALGGTSGSIDDMTERWNRAGEAIDRARVAVGLLNVEMRAPTPAEGAPPPGEGPSLSDSLTRFGESLLSQGRDVTDVMRGRGRLGQAAIQQARALERKRDLATLAARPQQSRQSPKEIRGGLVTDLFSDNRPLSLADQLGFTGNSPDSLAVLSAVDGQDAAGNDAALATGLFDEPGQLEREAGKRRAQADVTAAAYATSDAGRMAARQRDRELEREDRAQEQRLERMRSFTDRWRDLHDEQVDATAQAMESISSAIDAGGEAIGEAWLSVVTGQATAGEALQKGLSDFLLTVAKREAIEGGVEIAKGISALAGVYTAGLAPGHFAAAAAHFGVAAAAGAGGAAIAPSTPPRGGGGAGGASGPRERPLQREQDARGGGGNTNININLGGGVILGTAPELAQEITGLLNDPRNGATINPRRIGQ